MTLRELADEMARLRALGASVGPAGLEAWESVVRAELTAEDGRWLSEDRAVRRAGKAAGWFRQRRRGWVADGYARRTTQGAWEYHEAVVPRSRFQAEGADDPAEQARRDAA